MALYRTRIGTFRAYYLALVICIAAFMQGYDSGVAGGVLTFAPFRADFKYTVAQKTRVNSLTVGLQQLGAFVSSLIIFPLTEKYGRKKAIQFSAIIFCIGAVIETVNTRSLTAWYLGRFVAGFGQGGCSVVVPTYSAEMSPKEIRGRLGSLYQWMYVVGIFTSYWTNYGVKKGLAPNSMQWQLPVGVQLISGSLLFLSMFTLEESVRWLVKKDRAEDAWRSITWIRGDDSEDTRAELEEITLGVRLENEATMNVGWREVLEPSIRYRIIIASLIFVFQQGTGATALAYFSPQFFALLVGGSGERNLLITAVFGAAKLFACTFFILFMADRFGRRTLLIGGALFMGACMLSISLVYRFLPPPGSGVLTSPGIATVALLYLNVMAYNFSWGVVPWPYVPEIFPTRLRGFGVAVALAVHWLFSFVFSIATPYMIASWGWGTFLFYAILDVIMTIFVWFFVKETRGRSLESMEKLFESTAGHQAQKLELGLELEQVEQVNKGVEEKRD